MRGERGAALLEAMVAVVVLGLAAVAALTLASEAWRAVDRARSAQAAAHRAQHLMDAVALWPRDDLDRRLGERTQGPWRLRIQRPVPELYTLVLVDSLTGSEVVRTALFRPDTAHETR